jgi:hypothetical protein
MDKFQVEYSKYKNQVGNELKKHFKFDHLNVCISDRSATVTLHNAEGRVIKQFMFLTWEHGTIGLVPTAKQLIEFIRGEIAK